MSSFKDFSHWYNNKDVVPTLEAMQKMIAFYNDKRYRYVNAWLYFTKPSQHLPSQIYKKRFENMVMSCFQRTRPESEIESFFTTGRLKKNDCFSVDEFSAHCNTLLEAMGCFYHFCPCQELLPSLSEENIEWMQSSILSRKEMKTFWKNFKKMLLVVHPSFLQVKQLLMKLLFEKQQTYAKLLLGLTLAYFTPTRCVNPCLPVFIRVGISIQKRVYSHLDKTRPAALTIWSCPVSNEQDQNVKLKASLQQADRRKLTASVLMGLVLIARLRLKSRVDFTTSVPVKSCVPL